MLDLPSWVSCSFFSLAEMKMLGAPLNVVQDDAHRFFSFCYCFHGMTVRLMMASVAYSFYNGFKVSCYKSLGVHFWQVYHLCLAGSVSPVCDISGLSCLREVGSGLRIMRWLWAAAQTPESQHCSLFHAVPGSFLGKLHISLALYLFAPCPYTAMAVQKPHKALKSERGVVALMPFAPWAPLAPALGLFKGRTANWACQLFKWSLSIWIKRIKILGGL